MLIKKVNTPNHLESLPREVGRTEGNRPILVNIHGNEDLSLRTLIVAGQHGDEPLAREVVEQFESEEASVLSQQLRMQIAVIADANPDGTISGTRTNAMGRDLNRDHQRLQTAEAKALHRFVHDWQPQLIIDAHTFIPRRKVLLQHELVYAQDIMVDVATNPAIPTARQIASQMMMTSITSALNDDGYLADRYLLFRRGGRVRHSTPDVRDLRNALALRFPTYTVLLEGRQPTRFDNEPQADRTKRALNAALNRILRYSDSNRNELFEDRIDLSAFAPGDSVAIRCRYVDTTHPCEMCLYDRSLQAVRTVRIAHGYSPTVEATQNILLPAAYAVPRQNSALIELLACHGFITAEPDEFEGCVEEYQILDTQPTRRAYRAPRASVSVIERECDLADYVIYPIRQQGANALAVFLEPESKYGLARFRDLDLTIREGCSFPVLRVIR